MSLEDDLRTTIIKSLTLTEEPGDPKIDLEIRKATKEDFEYFESSDKHSRRDLQILRNADVCVVAREDDDVVHHSCAALESFQHSRTRLQIDINNTRAYIYNVWTKKSHRGSGIFQMTHSWLAQHLYALGTRDLYTEIDSLNKPSLKAFQKIGFQKVGERYTVDTGEFMVHIIIGESIYEDTAVLTTQIGNIELAKTHDDRFSRIERELEGYIDQWSESGDEVVLFGSGNHAQKITDRTKIGPLVSYAVDEDSSKIGSNVPNSDIPIQPVNALSKKDPDVIIICSEAFQSDMATRATAKSETADIIVLYPHVSRFEEKD